MSSRLIGVIAQVFGVPEGEIHESTSPDTLPRWDSLQHMHLIMALEAEYGVALDPEKAMEMLSVKLIRLTLKEHGIDNA